MNSMTDFEKLTLLIQDNDHHLTKLLLNRVENHYPVRFVRPLIPNPTQIVYKIAI